MGTAVTDAPLTQVEWPRLTRCRTCREPLVLALGVDGRTVFVLDAMPVIVGKAPCSACKGKGVRMIAQPAQGGRRAASTPGDLAGKVTKGSMSSCPECKGSGQRGELLTRAHVVMTHAGVCRRWQRLGGPWDSAYRVHVCAGASE
jgi:hypothetical protein